MTDLLRKIKIHPLLWIVLSIGGMTGFFKEILMLLLIVSVHELGHILMARRFNWRIRKIMLMPFGGIAEMDEYGNRPAKEEILVAVSGPLQHLWMIGLSFLLLGSAFWTEADHQLFLFHNIAILLFNLLPVLPLDGGKLLFSLQSYVLPFHKAYQSTFILSFVCLTALSFLSLFMLPFHLNLIMVTTFLWVHQYLEWKQRHYHFLRFLLERKHIKRERKDYQVDVSPALTVAEAVKNVHREKELTLLINKKQVIHEKVLLDAFFDRYKQTQPLSRLLQGDW